MPMQRVLFIIRFLVPFHLTFLQGKRVKYSGISKPYFSYSACKVCWKRKCYVHMLRSICFGSKENTCTLFQRSPILVVTLTITIHIIPDYRTIFQISHPSALMHTVVLRICITVLLACYGLILHFFRLNTEAHTVCFLMDSNRMHKETFYMLHQMPYNGIIFP